MSKSGAPRFSGNVALWATQVSEALDRIMRQAGQQDMGSALQLTHQRVGDKALVDGQLMYDPLTRRPVYSRAGAWLPFSVSPQVAFKPAAGQFFDNSARAHGGATLAGAANRIDMAPWFCPWTIGYDQVGVAVSTNVASAQCKVIAYAAGENMLPTTKLFETAALDAGASTGFKQVSQLGTFVGGQWYWLGVRHSSTATVRAVPVTSAELLGFYTGSNDAAPRTVLRRTLAFATAAPDPWGYVASELTANIAPPSVRFRAA